MGKAFIDFLLCTLAAVFESSRWSILLQFLFGASILIMMNCCFLKWQQLHWDTWCPGHRNVSGVLRRCMLQVPEGYYQGTINQKRRRLYEQEEVEEQQRRQEERKELG